LTLEIGLANWNHNENTNQGKQGHKRIYDNKKQINNILTIHTNELAGARWLTGRRTRKQSNKIWPEQNDALKAEKRSRPGARESERREKREKAVGTEKRSRPGARARESERREKREKAVGPVTAFQNLIVIKKLDPSDFVEFCKI
jgi:hypothetical protein